MTTHYILAPVPISVRPLTADEGGGFLATIPPWDKTYIADGETEQEAIDNLKELCKILENDFITESEHAKEQASLSELMIHANHIILTGNNHI